MPQQTTRLVSLRSLSFQYPSAATPLFSELDLHFEPGFTGIVGPNGSGKTTLLQLIAGELKADTGKISGTEHLVSCSQRTDAAPTELTRFLDDTDGSAYALRGRLGVEYDFVERWQQLSHGERKRAQIATALWQSPNVLIIDEPTNHIDSEARELLLQSLKKYSGIGIIVSHDRDLLDELCSQTVWLDPPTVNQYPGGYSKAKEQQAQARATMIHERSVARHEQQKLETDIRKRREKANNAHKERSKSGLAIKDHDARQKKNLARVTGKDGQAGRLLNQLDGRKQRADEKLDSFNINKEREVGIWLEGSKTRRNTLLEIEPLTLSMGEYRHLNTPNLMMQPDDRIAITGPNGMGKSTLLEALREHVNVPTDHLIYMPQEITAEQSREVLKKARALPNEALGHLMTIVSRLGSEPKRILQTDQPSPGEVRKLLLALGMSRETWLIIMDEPTNHLDLPSIEALERALDSCPCGLLLVSHDERFLDGLINTRWEITETSDGSVLTVS